MHGGERRRCCIAGGRRVCHVNATEVLAWPETQPRTEKLVTAVLASGAVQVCGRLLMGNWVLRSPVAWRPGCTYGQLRHSRERGSRVAGICPKQQYLPSSLAKMAMG